MLKRPSLWEGVGGVADGGMGRQAARGTTTVALGVDETGTVVAWAGTLELRMDRVAAQPGRPRRSP